MGVLDSKDGGTAAAGTAGAASTAGATDKAATAGVMLWAAVAVGADKDMANGMAAPNVGAVIAAGMAAISAIGAIGGGTCGI